jgi:aspartyl-tRNA(Asn)/glutamyl-tRNA(Gln) amidotransferase subunit B
MKTYLTTIGLEVHVQLKTASKMFCTNSAEYFGAQPNSHTCPVCLGLPGALPVANEKAIESVIRFALALSCKINKQSKFDRKNYFYPDLPKGYQISQFDLPIGEHGFMEVSDKKIGITRVHLEEDTGKLIHAKLDGENVSLVDFNRSGVPLMEIVSEPDIESPEEARNFSKLVHQIARYLGVSDADMEKAGMRFDANVSIRPQGTSKLGEKVEIKNINSFRFLEKALVYEIERQIKVLESGGRVSQETRGWVEAKNITVLQRSKETSPDYRYFPEPDLPPLIFDPAHLDKLRSSLPELPNEKSKRFEKEYLLDKKYVRILTEDNNIAQWYENALSLYSKDKSRVLANLVVEELLKLIREKNITISKAPIEPAGMVELLTILDRGEINQTTARKVLIRMFETGNLPSQIVEEEDLEQLSKTEDLESIVDETIRENQKAVEDFKNGKEASLGFLIGQVMKKTKGQANAKTTESIIREKIYGNQGRA